MVITDLKAEASFAVDNPVFKPLTTTEDQKQTLICLKNGQVLSNHKSIVDSILIVVSGQIKVYDGQLANDLEAGHALELEKNEMAKIEAVSDSVLIQIQVPNPKAKKK
jgi:quercetin dioxygenase-like cupin family protein